MEGRAKDKRHIDREIRRKKGEEVDSDAEEDAILMKKAEEEAEKALEAGDAGNVGSKVELDGKPKDADGASSSDEEVDEFGNPIKKKKKKKKGALMVDRPREFGGALDKVLDMVGKNCCTKCIEYIRESYCWGLTDNMLQRSGKYIWFWKNLQMMGLVWMFYTMNDSKSMIVLAFFASQAVLTIWTLFARPYNHNLLNFFNVVCEFGFLIVGIASFLQNGSAKDADNSLYMDMSMFSAMAVFVVSFAGMIILGVMRLVEICLE